MKQYNIIKSILSEPWAISEESCYALTPLVAGLFNSNLDFQKVEAIEPRSVVLQVGARRGDNLRQNAAASALDNNSPDQVSKTIAVITINGALTKENQDCGPVGTVQIGQWIKNADADPGVDGILLKIDSPGGSVAGIEELGNIIKNCTKPTIGFVDDQTCSAAYWLASCCDEIIANNTTADVGSIGVLMSFMDLQPYYEKQGVVFHTVTAPQSTEKVKMFEDVRAGKYDAYKNEVLKPLAQKFIDIVKANRPQAQDEKFYSGKVFYAQDVVGTLVDSIGTIDQALQRAADLSSESSNQSSTSNNSASNQNPSINMELTRFAKAANLEAIMANADGTITLTAEAAQAVESGLEVVETAATAQAELLTTATTSLTTSQTHADAQTALLATATARITELEAKVTELSGEAGADSAVVIPETDANAGATTENVFTRMARVQEILNK